MKLIHRLLPFDALYETCRRFPLPVICAVILYALILYDELRFSRIFTQNFAVMLTAAFFWLGGLRLLAEQMQWSLFRQASVACAGVACLYLCFFVIGDFEKNYFIVICALLLFLMFAPYISGGDDTSFWFYNRTLWFGVVVSYLALILFAGSVSLAFYAIDELFNIKIPSKLYGYIWSFAAVVLGPVYALSWVPKTFEFTKDDCADPPGLKFLIDWIVVPVGFFYLAILYVYFGKILVTQEVPKNQLVWLITGFISSGIVAYLIAWPMRDEGSFQVRAFYKIFFPAMIVPIGFLAYAIWLRIDDYGLTEERYLVVMAVLWFALLAIPNSITRVPIKALPMTLVPLLLFVSFGPWSYYQLPVQSQYSRLVTLLQDNGFLVDGQIRKAESPEKVSLDVRREITGVLSYLCAGNRSHVLDPLFGVNEGNSSCYSYEEESIGKGLPRKRTYITHLLGFSPVYGHTVSQNDKGVEVERFNFNTHWGHHSVVSGYDVFLPNVTARLKGGTKHPYTTNNNWKIGNEFHFKTALLEGNILELYQNEDFLFRVDLTDIAKTAYKQRHEKAPLIVKGSEGSFSYKIYVTSFSGEFNNHEAKINTLNFNFLFSHPDLTGAFNLEGDYE